MEYPAVKTLRMIRFSHTVFALPFALLSALLAARGLPEWRTAAWIVVAMVGARSAAMSFNRIADRDIDARNPRTKGREIPAGAVSLRFAAVFCAASATLFVLAAFQLNRLCFVLSPVALAVILGYSFTKRVTLLSHLVLGLGLSMAPVGAWLAVRGRFDLLPVLLGLAVLFWVAGFDVIYSLQDVEFDRGAGLHSIPARVGVARALLVARLLHVVAFCLWAAVWSLAGRGAGLGVGVALAGAFLVGQHRLVSPTDLSRVDAAFFTANGWLSVVLLLAGAVDIFWQKS